MIMFASFHSQRLTYFATMSPTPDASIFAGAAASMSVSPIITDAPRDGSETLSPARDIDEVADAKPSIDGAVPTMM